MPPQTVKCRTPLQFLSTQNCLQHLSQCIFLHSVDDIIFINYSNMCKRGFSTIASVVDAKWDEFSWYIRFWGTKKEENRLKFPLHSKLPTALATASFYIFLMLSSLLFFNYIWAQFQHRSFNGRRRMRWVFTALLTVKIRTGNEIFWGKKLLCCCKGHLTWLHLCLNHPMPTTDWLFSLRRIPLTTASLKEAECDEIHRPSM
jgi:hypothetical protein